ncbi:flagellar basal body P-ring protein FlgI [Seleniivibrio woodruffii]|uniref:Flagellar P-ring protein n=1 Tax=Seleniivibrio woodruffii TaxID=1078050 RepID=A0A4V2PSB7_9BACT|nr:flagellar basal body P-ring protein FlgI [Seleniivibrio woodruffii]TCK62111.1 flagellar P-ring protein precursor FlgI [Seleniivibrio woodruffii]TVZ34772.1 flagellar P-ring protein precursor FlgI [Seleniivibrio woodruffii]
MRTVFLTLLIAIFAQSAFALVKIRDISNVEGIRDNQLIGYGLVVGLNGTGDKSGTEFTVQSLVNMMERMGITVDKNAVKVKNVAAVMVTAKLQPFSKSGSKMDVIVSSVGDAKSLEGGTLLMTPLSAANGQVFAVAQGPVSVGGMNVAASGAGTVKNHPTVGMIPNGAIIEREIPFNMDETNIVLNFKNNNLSDMVKAKDAINRRVGANVAKISSPSTIEVVVPRAQSANYYVYMDNVLSAEIEPTNLARVVVDERTGTIVMGADVRINTVAVSHGNLTINISSTVEVQKDQNFIGQQGQNNQAQQQQQQITVTEEDAKLMIVPEGVAISDLVKALNSIGVTPRDLISILQAIKSAGALHGELQVM